ncbi:Alkaline phosphatase synthesis transcriptional regulatory protein PhoP [Acaryochloris thomasi RCC1774]|uniref:Alkaline phosphatase synthesis transcriptional regulatory protein PhoP n=1 Tax=Acaryochloris thomasi RCC1774 TaxID=1764569 RepID=A0A2W1JTN6_9CYAN|nr:response regulator [Acaryochloris thomasi]PZD72261.1 Alkaline phosphatase synthesis transcriptional regulatory protein PhoP [Acaryochloris thomasi RCC1774]
MAKIMVVDDSPTMRVMITDLLKHYQFDVVEAVDGQEAKTMLTEMPQSSYPDLLITDIVMPKMNGYELCRWIKDELKSAGIPVIMCSTKGEEFDRHWGMRQGGDAYVIKPFNPSELIETVKQLLKAKSPG